MIAAKARKAAYLALRADMDRKGLIPLHDGRTESDSIAHIWETPRNAGPVRLTDFCEDPEHPAFMQPVSRCDHPDCVVASTVGPAIGRVSRSGGGDDEYQHGTDQMKIVLLLGPVGSGKVSMARRMASELPEPPADVSLEAAWIRLGSGITGPGLTGAKTPFRAPHHTVSNAGLIGSLGRRVYPGEVSLAHGGCLLLDELPEFRRSCIESAGLALKAGTTVIGDSVVPSRPALVVACSNLCACGMRGGPRPCTCKPDSVVRWTYDLVEYCGLLGVTEIIPVRGRFQ